MSDEEVVVVKSINYQKIGSAIIYALAGLGIGNAGLSLADESTTLNRSQVEELVSKKYESESKIIEYRLSAIEATLVKIEGKLP